VSFRFRAGHVPNGHLAAELEPRHRGAVIVYAVVDDAISPDFPLGDSLEGDEPEIAAKPRIEERELEAGERNRLGVRRSVLACISCNSAATRLRSGRRRRWEGSWSL
jgi:hypothetical protein